MLAPVAVSCACWAACHKLCDAFMHRLMRRLTSFSPRFPTQVPPVFEGEATREKLRKLQPQAPLTIHLRQEIDR